jgi:hypothetical protein
MIIFNFTYDLIVLIKHFCNYFDVEDIFMKDFLKHSHYLYFVVAFLSLITYFVRQSPDNTIWLVLFFAWLSFGFTALARKKDKKK